MRLQAAAQSGALLAILTASGPATAATVDFLGIWANGDADASGIARLVIAPAGADQLSVQLFGKCPKQDCDWGTQTARLYADDPGARDIRTIAADFGAGGAHRRVVLRLAVGGALRFDLQADFAAGRGNFATSGNLTRTGGWRQALQIAAAAPPPSPQQGQDANPPPSPPSDNWLGGGGGSFIGFGAALPPGYVPSKWEECTPFNPDQVRAAPVDGGWRVGDFSHSLLNFGSSRAAAQRAVAVLGAYRFDEECVVTQGRVQMLYFKRAGLVPKSEMPNEDCDVLDPATVKAVEADGAWAVVAGSRPLFDFHDDKAAADRAVSVIRTYKLTRQCFFARDYQKAQYWLAQ